MASEVLRRSHGTLFGQHRTVVLEMRSPTSDSSDTELVSFALPDRLRYSPGDGPEMLLLGDEAWGWTGDQAAAPLQGDDLRRLRQLRALLAATYLEPLYRASDLRRNDRVLEFVVEGSPWRLELRADDLLPSVLTGPDLEVQFLELLDRPNGCLPSRVRLGSLGERILSLRDAGRPIPEAMLRPPDDSTPARADLVISGKRPTRTPEVQRVPAGTWIVVDDPGSWEQRRRTGAELGSRLYALGQLNSGDPLLFEEDGQDRFAIPIAPDPDQDGKALTSFDGGELRQVPERLVVAFDPPPDEAGFATRRDRGLARLRAFLTEQGLREAGAPHTVANLFFRDFSDPQVGARSPFRIEIPLDR